jgi:hypothetical protein
MHKYPRTPHISGSRLQPGDEDLPCVPVEALLDREWVVEEKIDGANSAISFDAHGTLRLQSRGHFLDGGPRERHFALLKSWANCHVREFWSTLRDRYVMFGEWVYAKHTIFYDDLPHYFIEFDVLDKSTGVFLATLTRESLLRGLPVASAPVRHRGAIRSAAGLQALIGQSSFQTAHWREALLVMCRDKDLNYERALSETDTTGLMEGLYLKVEDNEKVIERYKYVRGAFSQVVEASESHWLERPIVPNRLRPGVDIFAKEPKKA